MPMINFRAGEDLTAALRARAGDDDVALSALIRRACQELLDREDGEDVGPASDSPPPTENYDSPLGPAERHLHRFVATGAFRHEQGQRIDERKCACGEVTWS